MPKRLPIALALLLTACTATQINRQSNITLPENFQHTGQADSAPNLARWWQQWPDPQLGRLIEQGLQHNHSIAIARSRLEEARTTARLAEADLLPSAGLAADAKGYRNHRRDPYLGNGGKLTSASFRAAWEPDIFGQKRSDADAARAAALGSQEQLHGSRLLVSAQIAEHYLRAAHIQQQQTLVSQQLATLHELARYAAGRFNAGHATAHDTTAIAAQIQALQARQSTLQAQFDAQQRSIAVLIGQTPQTFRLDNNAMRQAALLQHLPSPPQGIRPGSLLNQRAPTCAPAPPKSKPAAPSSPAPKPTSFPASTSNSSGKPAASSSTATSPPSTAPAAATAASSASAYSSPSSPPAASAPTSKPPTPACKPPCCNTTKPCCRPSPM